MARYSGRIGYVLPIEVAQGVYEERPIERNAVGDVVRMITHTNVGESVNDNIQFNNQIRIMGDAYSFEHCFAIRYVWWMGHPWKVTAIEVNRPRLILSIGGIYNGPVDEKTRIAEYT